MTEWAGGICLLGGALVSLLAAVGVLRLPDVFMRMHAATKSGVVGCGLILVGVALVDGSLMTGLKVAVATLFLLLTTPVAGHLLGRAAYVSGASFWRGMADDQLTPALPRRRFGPRQSPHPSSLPAPREAPLMKGIQTVVLALAQGPRMGAAIAEAVALARRHEAELCGVAVIDEPRLFNVGPIPIGGGQHAAELRKWRMTKARQAAADVIQHFESQARAAGVVYSVRVEEGRPHTVLRSLQTPGTVIGVAPEGWFDQGVLEQGRGVVRRLVDKGVYPLLVLGTNSEAIHRVRFLHDGSERSRNTWRWLLETNPWPETTLVINSDHSPDSACVEQALEEAQRRGCRAEPAGPGDDSPEYVVIGNAESRGWLPRWLKRRSLPDDEKILAIG